MNRHEKIMTLIDRNDDDGVITIDHINIRQSIFFLVFRLIILEIISAFLLLLFRSFFFVPIVSSDIRLDMTVFLTPVFVFFVLLKVVLMLFIVIQWVSEYYEVTKKDVVHKRGFIFKKEQRCTLDHIGSVRLEQGVFGRIFNYGTLRLYNWVTENDFTMYLIHNPNKYHMIVKDLTTRADQEKQVFREHILETEPEESVD